MTKIYGIRSCDTCRKALAWLASHHIKYEFIDLRADGIDEGLVRRWQKVAGWETLLNKRSITWRKIPPFDREDLNADKACELILSFPTVMKRPVLDNGKQVILGFNGLSYDKLQLK
ncbi:MAG: Spx/MgsR family RNA polymerase-binding regulatory protein [Gammaproteobacteria bacterium]|nr:MAG: Spx/MgsR family RNA polymerase-binding regulatory protein [Gammaproteobacteria bacterium]